MNLLFCACPRLIYGFFTEGLYPDAFAPIPPVVDKVPDYTSYTNKNDRATTCAKYALNKKTRADIITMNAALTDVFLDAVSVGFHTTFQQWRLRKPNMVFVDMFKWFAQHYGMTGIIGVRSVKAIVYGLPLAMRSSRRPLHQDLLPEQDKQ